MKPSFLFSVVACFLATGSFAQTKGGTEKLTPETLWQLKRVSAESMSRDGAYVYYGVSEPNVKANKSERNIFRVPVGGGAAQQITSTEGYESNAQTLPDGKLLFTYKGQLWITDADGQKPNQLSKNDAGYDNVKLSPDGKKILFTRAVKVRKAVKDNYPDLDKADALVTDNLMYRHWTEYENEFASHPFVADLVNNAVTNETDLMPSEPFDVPQQPDGGPEDLTWSNDGSYALYVCKKLSGKDYALSTNTDIYRYDIASGNTTNLSEGMKGYDTKPAVSADGKTIYWLSMAREGYEADKNDLIAYDLATKKKTNLTSTWDNTVEDFALSNDKKHAYLLAYADATEQVFDLTLPSGKASGAASPKQLTSGDFDIHRIVTQQNNQLLVERMDMNHANELYTVTLADGGTHQLTHTNDEVYAKLGMCRIEKHWITTTDKQKMLVWLILPPDFTPAKKYPALLYCQGGPQSAVSQFYSFRWNFQLMASQGYVVIAPCRRGMPGFGVRWNEEISKDWGGQAMRDYLTATDSLSSLPFVDKSRVGAVGASYGGYSVYMLAGVHNNRFKTFIAHCGLFDLKSWYGTTEEMWFANWDIGGPYWQRGNAELYAKSDPMDYVQNWNRPIMVIHGERDFRVPVNQGLEAFQLAQLKGLKSRLLLFHEEGHWVMQPQDGLLWQREFYKWLSETL